jgi:hypothetical protein
VRRWRGSTVGAALAAGLLLAPTGCATDDVSGPEATPTAPEETEEPASPDPAAPDPPAPDQPIEDGRHPVYLVEVDGPGRVITFDLIQFLTGDEAITAYREDTPEDPEGTPPNDYHVRNVNPQLRSLPVADDVAVTVVRLGEASGAGSVPSTFDELPAHLDDQPAPEGRLAWNPSWLTVDRGVITAIDEQYLP